MEKKLNRISGQLNQIYSGQNAPQQPQANPFSPQQLIYLQGFVSSAFNYLASINAQAPISPMQPAQQIAAPAAGQVDRNRISQIFANYRTETEGVRDAYLNDIEIRKAQLVKQGLKQDAVDNIFAGEEAWIKRFYGSSVQYMANSINSAFNLGIRP